MSFRTWRAARQFGLSKPLSRGVRVEKALRVPMRDGVELIGDRYYSTPDRGQPVILIRSPYGRFSGFAMTARLYAERGFQVFLQSCRGTFGSGGTLDPIRQEKHDGLDTLAWLEQQPWCVGPVHSFGMSYLGMVQWAMAAPAGDRIAGMTLHFTLSNYRNEALSFDGLALKNVLGWATMMFRLASAKSPFALIGVMLSRIKPEIYGQLPLKDVDVAVVGVKVPWWRDWMDHGDPRDPWWDSIDFTKTIPEISAPANMIAGWHDIFLPWQLKDFEAMCEAGKEAWLTIGPWHHTAPEGGGEAIRSGIQFHTALATGSKIFPHRERVRLFVQGANEWREFSTWPPRETRVSSFWLDAGGGLSTDRAKRTTSSRFRYDPADPTPSMHMVNPFKGPSKPKYMSALETRPDSLLFTAPVCEVDQDVIGPVEVDVYLRSTCTYTDVYACLCDVDPKGRSTKVCDGYVRLSLDHHPISKAGIRRATVECWPTAYRFKKGHALRLILAGGAHPHWARNLGTGDHLGTGEYMIAQEIEILHDEEHGTALRIRS